MSYLIVLIVMDIVMLVWLALITFLIFRYKNYSINLRKIKFNNLRGLKVKRYLVFSVISNDKIEGKELEEAIRNAVKELLGEIWLEIANPHIIYFDENKLEGIISTTRAGYKVVIASLPLVKESHGKKLLIYSRKTTGSLRKAKKILGI
ncbi:MAG: ribonuclease P [Sulfolobus sp.]|nr:ribonuclease P [Sulfolobus sp.]